MASIQSLANELLYGITEYLELPDLNALLQSSRRLYTRLTPSFRKLSITAQNAPAALYCAAAVGGNRPLISLLLETGKGIIVLKDSSRRPRPMHSSPSKPSEETIDFVLAQGPKLVLQHGLALHWAALKGRTSLVKALLKSGAGVSDRDMKYSTTALHHACAGLPHSNDKVINYLLDNGADMGAVDNNGRPVLDWAVKKGNNTATELLIKRSVDINRHNKTNGVTALHTASTLRDGTIVKMLLENGADVNSKDYCGMTALHVAASRGHEAAVRLLLENGADINAQDGRHSSPLHLAAQGETSVYIPQKPAHDMLSLLIFSYDLGEKG